MEKYANLLVKRKVALLLLILAIGLPTTSHALATFLLSPPSPPQPQIKGTFNAVIEVFNVVDVYAWQAKIVYDHSKLRIEQILPGDFLGNPDWPFFVTSTDSEVGMLLLHNTLCGEAPGKTGSGKLAIIVFGYYSNDFEQPQMVFDGKTWLLNSALQMIPLEPDMMKLNVAKLS